MVQHLRCIGLGRTFFSPPNGHGRRMRPHCIQIGLLMSQRTQAIPTVPVSEPTITCGRRSSATLLSLLYVPSTRAILPLLHL